MDYTTIAEVKAYGNVQATTSDGLLADVITGYSRQVDTWCGQTLGAHTVVHAIVPAVVDKYGFLLVYPTAPVLTLTALGYAPERSTTWTDGLLSEWETTARPSGAIVRSLRAIGTERQQRTRVRLSYMGGYQTLTDVPADVRLAVRQLVWWGLKLRDAPIHATAGPDFGMIIPPQTWPKHILHALRLHRRAF